MTAAPAEARQSIETLVTRQASQGLPSDPGLSMQIGTVKKLGNFWEGKILHNKADHKLQNTTGKLAGFFVCVLCILKVKSGS